MLFVCISCGVNNERNVSPSFPAQMVPCPPLVENAAEEEGEWPHHQDQLNDVWYTRWSALSLSREERKFL